MSYYKEKSKDDDKSDSTSLPVVIMFGLVVFNHYVLQYIVKLISFNEAYLTYTKQYVSVAQKLTGSTIALTIAVIYLAN